MNNACEIVLGDKKLPLLFGLMSYYEFTSKVTSLGGANFVQSTVHLVYAGHANWCAVKQKPAPKYEDIFEIVEQLYESEEGILELEKVQQCYEKSVAGEKMFNELGAAKKKIQEQNIPVSEEVEKVLTLIQ